MHFWLRDGFGMKFLFRRRNQENGVLKMVPKHPTSVPLTFAGAWFTAGDAWWKLTATATVLTFGCGQPVQLQDSPLPPFG